MSGEGWEVKVRSVTDLTSLMAVVPSVTELTAADALSDVSGGSVTLPADDPTLVGKLPNGLVATVQVPVEGIYSDPIDRPNKGTIAYKTPPGDTEGFIDLGTSYAQFVRFPSQGSGRIFLFYQDDGNCLVCDFNSPNPVLGQTMTIYVMNNGVRTVLPDAMQFTISSALWGAAASIIGNTLSVRFVQHPDAVYYGQLTASTSLGTGSLAGWTPGTQAGYRFDTGSINRKTNVVVDGGGASAGRPWSFLMYGLVQPWSLGTFPGINAPWVDSFSDSTWAHSYAPLQIVNNSFRISPGPHACPGNGDCSAFVDVGASDGSWQATARNINYQGTVDVWGLILRAGPGSTGIYVGQYGASQTAAPSWWIQARTGSSVQSSGPLSNFVIHATPPLNDGDILRVTYSGPHFKVWVNSQLCVEFDTTLNQTSSIMGVWGYTHDPAWWLPVEWEQFGSGEPTTRGLTKRWELPTYIGVAMTTVNTIPTDLISDVNLWDIYNEGKRRVTFWAEKVDESIVTNDGQALVQVSGRGPAACLEWGKVFPKNWPTPTSGNDWSWKATPPMAVFLELLATCQGRGTLTWVNPTFTATHDSDGVEWSLVTDLDVSPGDDLLQILQRMAALVAVDWHMTPDFYLAARQTYGLHKEDHIWFWPGGQQTGHTRTRDRSQIANAIAVEGAKNIYAGATDETSIGKFHRRELYVNAGDATSPTQGQLVASSTLKQFKDQLVSQVVTVPTDVDGAAMFDDYAPGDWVGITSDDGKMDGAFRVVTMAVSVDKDGNQTGELGLQSKKDIALLRLRAIIDKMVAGGTGSSSTGTAIPINKQIPDPYLSKLTDVNVDGLDIGDVLKWNGSKWVPLTIVNPSEDLGGLTDVDTQTNPPTNAQYLGWSSSRARWIPFTPPTAVPSGGTTGQVLKKNSGTTGDVGWANDVGFADPTTTKGDLIVHGSSITRFAVGADGTVLMADSTQTAGVKWASPPWLTNPLTTKGDLIAQGASGSTRLGVGANGQILQADSASPAGIKWGALAALLGLASKGDVVAFDGANVVVVPVGTAGQVLTADASKPAGISWQTPASTNGTTLPARGTISYTTGSLAAGATENGTVAMATGYRLLRIQLSAAARVQLYTTLAARTADASRAWGTDPGVGTGLVLDYQSAAAVTDDLSPMVDGFSMESTPSTNIPISITASTAGVVTVTFTWIRTE